MRGSELWKHEKSQKSFLSIFLCLHSILPILGICNTDGYRMMQAERTVLAYPVLSMIWPLILMIIYDEVSNSSWF